MKKLSLKTSFGFAIGDIGGNLYFSLVGFIFLFYLTDELGLSGALAGTAMMIGKIWDAISDPIVSSLSDRCKSKFGRRRPFIFWGALLLFTLLVITFSLPKFSSKVTTFIVYTIMFSLLNTSFTLVNIPYSSLQPELTDDYNETTKLTGLRMFFAIIGTLLAVLGRPIAEYFGTDNRGWTYMAVILGLIMLISSWITVFTVEESKIAKKKQKSVFLSFKEALINKEFIFALIPWVLFVTAVTVIQTSFLYYFKYIYNKEGLFELSLFGLIIVSLLSLPLWVIIAKRIDKGPSYILGMSIFSIGLILIYFLSPYSSPYTSVIIISFSGIGFSTHYIMPNAIIPDIIELDYIRSGIRREGVYYSIWNFLLKLGQALAGLVIGLTLDIVGFIPPVNGSKQIVLQSKNTLDGIAFLCGPIPVFLLIIGILVLRKYPISINYYNMIKNEKY
ncbi:MFS transporter [Thiospirochaeta perfilievii]|nr:MFS transporter [Thiospirochaeta perfilievii]